MGIIINVGLKMTIKIYISIILFFFFSIFHNEQVTLASEEIARPISSSICEFKLVLENSPECIPIKSWSDFVSAISVKDLPGISPRYRSVILCPFRIQKTTPEVFIVSKSVQVYCQKERECIIDAFPKASSIIRIRGEKTQIRIQGIVFSGSTGYHSAVHVAFGANSKQLFCNCSFLR